jgi:hypothetical protein
VGLTVRVRPPSLHIVDLEFHLAGLVNRHPPLQVTDRQIRVDRDPVEDLNSTRTIPLFPDKDVSTRHTSNGGCGQG